jgi:hypothetical protein
VNNLDDLRDAMHTTPGFEPKPLDLDHVLAAGGRLRRRRRAVAGGAAGLAVLVLLVGGAQLARPDESAPTGLPAAAPPAAAPSAAVPPAADPSAAVPPAQEPEDSAPLGDVVGTGMRVGGDEQVVWMRAVHEPVLPDITVGMVLGRRTAAGALTVDVVTNETEGSDRAPGFHGLEMAMVVNDRPTPAFGYYVGAAAKITVVADGRKIEARQATWSEDPSVKLFWFPLKQVKPASKVGKAMAYDKNGRKLPAGNAGFAVG